MQITHSKGLPIKPLVHLSIFCVMAFAFGCDRAKRDNPNQRGNTAKPTLIPREAVADDARSDASENPKTTETPELVGNDVSDASLRDRTSGSSSAEAPKLTVSIVELPKVPFPLDELILEGVEIAFADGKTLLTCSTSAKCFRWDVEEEVWTRIENVPVESVYELVTADDGGVWLLGAKGNQKRAVAVRYTFKEGFSTVQPARNSRDDLYLIGDNEESVVAHRGRFLAKGSAAKRLHDRLKSLLPREDEELFVEQDDRGQLIACKQPQCIAHSPEPGYCRDIEGSWFFRGHTASATCGGYAAVPQPGGITFRRLTDGRPVSARKMFSTSHVSEPGPPIPSYCLPAVSVSACTPQIAVALVESRALAESHAHIISVPGLETLAKVEMPEEQKVMVPLDDGSKFVADGSRISEFAEASGALAWMTADGRVWVALQETD